MSRAREHAYPQDLALFARDRWGEDAGATAPPLFVLEELLSTCYQASLMREEDRPVTFRLLLGEPEGFPPAGTPPAGLHRHVFGRERPLTEGELRRLAPAADFRRSLIAARNDEEEGLLIWGLVQSGPRWLQEREGGRESFEPLPPLPVVGVTGPGRIAVDKGSEAVARLETGRLSTGPASAFSSRWLQETFAPITEGLVAAHEAAKREARSRSGEEWADLDHDVAREIGERMTNRLLCAIRDSGHGATLVLVPPHLAGEIAGGNPYVNLKYEFVGEEESGWRFTGLLLSIMNALARAYGRGSSDAPVPVVVGWEEYLAADDATLAESEEAIFELASLVASLSAVDGAVVMTHGVDLIGFGGEISGRLDDVPTVMRALDSEGARRVEESAEDVGTRHRSAYRLAGALPEAVVYVVSQDGGVRFVKRKDGAVTYWEQ